MPRKLIGKAGHHYGSWTLVDYIDAGGNGEVWRATSPRGEGALKLLKSNDRDSDNFSRFRDEIEVNKLIATEPGVLPLLDSDIPEKGRPWMVFPLAELLRDALEDAPLRDVVAAISEVADTLSALKEKLGVAHRDIKPGNLFKLQGRAVPGDFGLADFPDKQDLTPHDRTLGPRFFMPDEMIQRPDLADGHPADVFSLAKTLWILATGQHYPPQGQQRIDVQQNLITSYRRDMRALILDRFIQRATATIPSDRPSMKEFHAELDAWLHPPAAQTASNDLSTLAREFSALLAPADSDTRAREARRNETDALMKELSRRLESLRSRVQTISALQVDAYERHTPPNLLRALRSALSTDADMETTHLHTWTRSAAVGLHSGFRVAVGSQGTVALCAFHVLVEATGNARALWTDQEHFSIQSACQEHSVERLLEALSDQLEPALRELLRNIELLEKARLLGQ